jgi:hypothetical protein
MFMGRASSPSAFAHLERGEWDQALDLFGQRLAIWQQLGAPSNEANTFEKLGAQADLSQARELEAQLREVAGQ